MKPYFCIVGYTDNLDPERWVIHVRRHPKTNQIQYKPIAYKASWRNKWDPYLSNEPWRVQDKNWRLVKKVSSEWIVKKFFEVVL